MRFLEFEKPLFELKKKIDELREMASSSKELHITAEIHKLELKYQRSMQKLYSNLTPWQKVLVARHEDRPQFLDYVREMCSDFEFLSGDRLFADDHAILGGIGHFDRCPVMIIGQQKGDSTESRLFHNFGMAKPEGYRKAKRLIEMADKFHLPILTFVNTSGAYPGIDSEERGQSEAIARCTLACVQASVPIISVVIGEGGSGGAIAIATANRVIMMEHSFYSVISPEGCASILWKTAEANSLAASEQRLTAQNLFDMHVIDDIATEPLGGAHRNKQEAIQNVIESIRKQWRGMKLEGIMDFQKDRQRRFSKFGLMNF